MTELSNHAKGRQLCLFHLTILISNLFELVYSELTNIDVPYVLIRTVLSQRCHQIMLNYLRNWLQFLCTRYIHRSLTTQTLI